MATTYIFSYKFVITNLQAKICNFKYVIVVANFQLQICNYKFVIANL